MPIRNVKPASPTSPTHPTPVSSMRVARRVAALVHRVARADGLSMSETVERMLLAYVEKHHPDWELVFDDAEKVPVGRPWPDK